jgi:hypothetical protein
MKYVILICLILISQACTKKAIYDPRQNTAEIVEPVGLNGEPSGYYSNPLKTLSGTIPAGLSFSIHQSTGCSDQSIFSGSSIDLATGITYQLPEGLHNIYIKESNESGNKCFGPYRNYTIDMTPPEIVLDGSVSNNITDIPRFYNVKGVVSDNIGVSSLSFHKNDTCSDSPLLNNSQDLFNGAGITLDQTVISNLQISKIYAKVTDLANNQICKLLVTYNHIIGPASNLTSYFTIEKNVIAPKLPIQSNDIHFIARDINGNAVSGLNPILKITPSSNASLTVNMVETVIPGDYKYTANIGENYLVEINPGSIVFEQNRVVGNVIVTDTSYCYNNNGLVWTDHKQSGSGTVLQPYLICSADQLKSLAQSIDPLDFSKYYKLMIDLNLSSYLSNVNNEFSIGSGLTSFSGSFDGNNLSISNFKPKNNEMGLFHKMIAGEIKNLTLSSIGTGLVLTGNSGILVDQINTTQNVNLTNLKITSSMQIDAASTSFNFGVVGLASVTGAGQLSINKVNVNSAITNAKSNIGGLIGFGSSPSSSKANLNEIDVVLNVQSATALNSVGGIVGEFQSGTITNAKSNMTINGTSALYVGGITGRLNQGVISDVLSIGQVNLTDVNGYGGITGRVANLSSVTDSVSLQNITANNCLVECGKVIGSQFSIDNDFLNLHTSNQTTFSWNSIAAINSVESSVNLLTQPGYFYTATNIPFNAFDFVNIWNTVSGNYPVLRFSN